MHLLSFQTVFIINENIKWLEEFIQYYRTIGFDHFYLYDNEGTVGDVDQGGTTTHNKYGMRIQTTTSAEDRQKFEEILGKYKDCITHVKWQPRNQRGEIIYGQHESISDFITRFGHETEWVACMDFDEYVYSPSNIDIRGYLRNVEDTISCIKICQKKFKDRHISTKARILEEFECVDLVIGDWWGAKNIFRPKDFISMHDPHTMYFKNGIHVIDQQIMRFNHYNTNQKQLDWMSQCMGVLFSLNSIDDGMKRYT